MNKKSAMKAALGPRKKTEISIEILDVAITGTQRSEVLRTIGLQRKEMLHVATVNPEFVMEAKRSSAFAQVLSKCLTVADGWGVVWGHRLLEHGSILASDCVLERVSGFWLANTIIARAAEKSEKVFLLGAAPGVASQAAANLSKKYPQLKIMWYSGAKTVKLEKNEEASMTIAKINAYEPDYLLVAYGSPWQDIWIEENRPYLRARVAIGVGGVLDEWAGVVTPCPSWLDQMGGKWLWRVLTQPWRFGRILRVMKFGLLVVIMRLKRLF